MRRADCSPTKKPSLVPRRHSITVAALQSVKPVNASDVLGGSGGGCEPKPRTKRRQSIQESFQSLTA